MIWRLRLSARRLVLAGLACLVTLTTISGCAQLAQKERELVFRIEPGTARWYGGTPEGIREFNIPVRNGERQQNLHAWWWPAAGANAPAVLYLHGARWNLTGQLFRIEQLREFGFSVLAIDYRGFGKSEGELPSEESVYADAEAGWERLVQLQPDAAKRFIYGHSLGGAVAVDLAVKLSTPGNPGALPARGLIIESSFTSLADMARAVSLPWLPVGLILSQKFDSENKIPAVRMPLLLVHGQQDRYVPASFSQRLYEAASAPKKLLMIEHGSHNNSMRSGSAAYRQALADLFGIGNGTLTASQP